ncbi:two-pore potassium channel 3-like isoform X2 [Macadamia integrifolia]|uniref:two-pore potassium channel 3-like isoform X2 n=1 Tax=Macadamia integrifolia TaxID=60698 RepID=UPI001C4EC53A|nr:two-pore potassium channel 3-like isoform X2 [Macadamia integrifolia]
MDDELLLSKETRDDDDDDEISKAPLLRRPTSSFAHCINSDQVIIPIVSPSSTHNTTNPPSFYNLIAELSIDRRPAHRSHSAPCLFTDTREVPSASSIDPNPTLQSTPWVVRQAFIGVFLYILVGVVIYVVRSGSFGGHKTFKPIDGLYFSVVTLCTIGYGDIVPDTEFTKFFTCLFILVGFGFIDILLNGLVTYVLDQQESVMLSAVDENRFNEMFQAYVIDRVKGRMRIRMKVGLALGVVIVCIAVGTVMVHLLEGLDWTDSFYLSVASVTTVGYGDYAFKTLKGRCFAIIWLLVSTLAVARAFLYLTELRIDKRNRKIAKWVLQKKMTLGDLVAADLDNDGSIRVLLRLDVI